MDSFNPLLSFRYFPFGETSFCLMAEITEKEAKLWFSIKFEQKKAM